MKNLKLYEDFGNERVDELDAYIKLYNGIENDASIRRYSMQWQDVQKQIKTRRRTIRPDDSVQFGDTLVKNALELAQQKGHKKLAETIERFARELSINIQTLRDKR